MKHLGWKIAFGLSWVPGLGLYGSFIYCWNLIGKGAVETLLGSIGFWLLGILSILFLALQVALGYLSFRR